MKPNLCVCYALAALSSRSVTSFAPMQHAFIVRARTTTTTDQLRNTETRNIYRDSGCGDKPTRTEIEEAAGQRVPVALTPSTKDAQAVQGLPSKKSEECCRYGSNLSDEKLMASIDRLTEPRGYPLFLMEKAAKIMGDLLPKQGPSKAPVVHSGKATKTKEKLVVLGTGWGAAALLSGIDTERYDVTVISPRNYFLFTPMLAGASVGTVNVRSITQPIREFNRQANYLEAAASSIDTKAQTVACQGVQCEEECEIVDFTVPYDRLVVAVGARTNTFGIPGVEEHCLFLKQVDHARQIRRKIVNNFERANFPGLSENKLQQLLTFAVIGAGPTGVEFAGELRDFIETDGPKYYPHLLKHVRIKVIEATPVILRPFDESLREAAVEALTSKPKNEAISKMLPGDLMELMINKKVEEVTQDKILLGDGTNIPHGLAVWAGGIGPLPVTLEIIEAIGGMQNEAQKVARGKIAVDPWLRAIDGNGRIFAMGDCACTQSQCLPATAQVAAQEGEFLAHILSNANLTTSFVQGVMMPPRLDPKKTKLLDTIASVAVQNNEYMAPFQFLDMGILAYTGGLSALAQVQVTPDEKTRVKAKGQLGYGLWRSVYLMKQASMRNRVLVFLDWIKVSLFGRDVTSIN